MVKNNTGVWVDSHPLGLLWCRQQICLDTLPGHPARSSSCTACRIPRCIFRSSCQRWHSTLGPRLPFLSKDHYFCQLNCQHHYLLLFSKPKRTNDIGEDEVPASDEGPQFAHCHIGVEVSRARFGNTGSKFSIAQTSQDRGQGGDEEREDNGGSRGVSGHSSSQHVHTSTQSAADAQGHQIERVKASGEVGLFRAAVHNLHSQELWPNVLKRCQHFDPHLSSRHEKPDRWEPAETKKNDRDKKHQSACPSPAGHSHLTPNTPNNHHIEAILPQPWGLMWGHCPSKRLGPSFNFLWFFPGQCPK